MATAFGPRFFGSRLAILTRSMAAVGRTPVGALIADHNTLILVNDL